MTKERYLEMCEMLGNEPVEEDIPIEFEDLPVELQEMFYIYNMLQDTWEYMGGNYTGKNLQQFWKLVELNNVPKEDVKLYYDVVLYIDRKRTENIQKEQKSKQKPA